IEHVGHADAIAGVVTEIVVVVVTRTSGVIKTVCEFALPFQVVAELIAFDFGFAVGRQCFFLQVGAVNNIAELIETENTLVLQFIDGAVVGAGGIAVGKVFASALRTLQCNFLQQCLGVIGERGAIGAQIVIVVAAIGAGKRGHVKAAIVFIF